jgi:hypothetical protein
MVNSRQVGRAPRIGTRSPGMLVEEGFPKSQDAPVGLNKHVFLTRRVTSQKRLFVTANVSGGRGNRDQATNGAALAR